MQLHLLATVAAAAFLAASANALPYTSKQHHMSPATYAQLYPPVKMESTVVGTPARRHSSRKTSRRSPNGALSALINLVRRQNKQQPMMTASARQSLRSKKRKTCTAKSSTGSSSNSTTTGSSGSGSASNTTVSGSGTVSTGNSTSSSNSSMYTIGYWADWTIDQLAPEDIAWSKYDIIHYAFASPQSDSTISIDSASILKRMVTAAHKGNSKLVLSVGGAGQSSGFPDAVADNTSMAKFVKNLVALQKQYNLDGFDFDWEYPNNLISSRRRRSGTGQDTKNFQTFLQMLRPALPTGTIMSAAVPQEVWQGADGSPVGSVARAASALDYIVVMNYDVWGSSSTPGPNAPLANLCGNSTQPVASAAGGVKAWTGAGMPREKIVLGVPYYGYINTSTKKTLIQRRSSTATLESSDGNSGSGQINFSSLVSQGALVQKGSEFDGTGGFTKYWDDCSDTPYLSNGNIVVTYDDPDSLKDKAEFAVQAGIAGVAAWSIDGDTSKYALINSIRTGLGKS